MVGVLFWDLGERDDYESILSRTAVLFYCVAFFIFFSVAVLPFTVMERDIVDKEVLNRSYCVPSRSGTCIYASSRPIGVFGFLDCLPGIYDSSLGLSRLALLDVQCCFPQLFLEVVHGY